jgi:lipoprotein-releasing system permease protein
MPRWFPAPLERWIALRYLRGQRGTRGATLQTVVAIGGIATGVMALMVVLGVMNGLRDDLRNRILTASPHIRVLNYGDTIRMDEWESVLAQVRGVSGVVAAAPEVISQTLLLNRSGWAEGAKVAGIEPGEGADDVVGLADAMVEGTLFATEPVADSLQGSVVLGTRLAKRMNALPGDIVQLVAPTSLRTSRVTGTPTPVYWRMQVSGIFETGMYIYDSEFVVMDRATAQDFAGLGKAVSDLAVKVADPWAAPEVADAIVALLGPAFRAETWQQQNAALFSALQLEKLGMGLVIFFIMIVAAFNIVGTLTMLVAFKTREIGILRAMGMSAAAVRRVFLAQGAIIGISGTGLGLILGTIVSLVVDRSGLIRLDPAVYFIDRLPIRMDPLDIALVAVTAIGLALVATIHPSRQAAALLPVEAIRAE